MALQQHTLWHCFSSRSLWIYKLSVNVLKMISFDLFLCLVDFYFARSNVFILVGLLLSISYHICNSKQKPKNAAKKCTRFREKQHKIYQFKLKHRKDVDLVYLNCKTFVEFTIFRTRKLYRLISIKFDSG